MTNYSKGRDFEYKVMHRFEEAGYTVFRTAGSHGIADVIAIKKQLVDDYLESTQTEVLLIQCKYGSLISKKEREKLFALDLGPQVDCVVAWRKPRHPVMLYNKFGEFNLD